VLFWTGAYKHSQLDFAQRFETPPLESIFKFTNMGGYSFHHQTGQFIPAGAGSHEPIPQAFPPTALFPGLLSTSQTIAWPEGETDAREDAPVRVWPQNTERVVSQNGKIDYYERILPPPDSSNVKPLAHLWLKKIGKFLAQYVLSIEGAGV
jgi:hypothetical protein